MSEIDALSAVSVSSLRLEDQIDDVTDLVTLAHLVWHEAFKPMDPEEISFVARSGLAFRTTGFFWTSTAPSTERSPSF